MLEVLNRYTGILSFSATIIIGISTIWLTIHYNNKLLKRDEISKKQEERRHLEFSIIPLANNFISKYELNEEKLSLCNIANKCDNIKYIISFNKNIYNEFRNLPEEVKTYLYSSFSLEYYVKEKILSEEDLFLYMNKGIDLKEYLPKFSNEHLKYTKDKLNKTIDLEKVYNYIEECKFNYFDSRNFNPFIYILFYITNSYSVVKDLIKNYELKKCLNINEDLYLLCLYEFYKKGDK